MHVQTISYVENDAGSKFVKSLHETGFAVLKDHPISDDLLVDLYTGWREFFRSEEKYAFRVTETLGTQEGYYPIEESETAVGHAIRDLKEYYHVTCNGPIPPKLVTATMTYRRLSWDLACKLLTWVQDHTPSSQNENLKEPFWKIISLEASLLRILNYPSMTGNEDANAVRAAPHEDINLITLLPASDQPGLQVQDTGGGWHDVSTNTQELIINTGDMLLEATDGYFPSTTHRVINPGGSIPNSSRISAPFFITPRLDVALSDRYTAGSYLQERLCQITRD